MVIYVALLIGCTDSDSEPPRYGRQWLQDALGDKAQGKVHVRRHMGLFFSTTLPLLMIRIIVVAPFRRPFYLVKISTLWILRAKKYGQTILRLEHSDTEPFVPYHLLMAFEDG